MIAKEEPYSDEVVSKQTTQITIPSCRLEWKIGQLIRLIKLFQNQDNLISKQFGSLQAPSIKWELLIYPNKDRYNSAVSLRLLCKESVRARVRVYAVDAKSMKVNRREIIDTIHHERECVLLQVPHNDMVKALKEDGSLLLICKIEHLLNGPRASVEQTLEADRLDNSSEKIQLLDSFKNMLTSELFADCAIKVDDKTLRAHRCVLGQNSEVFRSMFAAEGMLENQNGIVEIKDSNFEAVQAMIEYMYTGSTDMLENCAEEMLFLADKYAIFSLKKLCERYISTTINCKNVISNAMLADTHSASILKQACAKYISLHHKDILCYAEWEVLKMERSELARDILEAILIGDNASDLADLDTKGCEEPYI